MEVRIKPVVSASKYEQKTIDAPASVSIITADEIKKYGIRVNDNIFDQAPVGNDFILDTDLIERIEIIRGPSYALYGNNAFLVVINVITKNGGEISGVAKNCDRDRSGSFFAKYSQQGVTFETSYVKRSKQIPKTWPCLSKRQTPICKKKP